MSNKTDSPKVPGDSRERLSRACITAAKALSLALACAPAYVPSLALAEGGMLAQSVSLLSTGVKLIGGIIIVFGLVNLGLALKDGAQGGGGQLAGAISMIVGGAVVMAAAMYFDTLGDDVQTLEDGAKILVMATNAGLPL